jgi:hypothetical protein
MFLASLTLAIPPPRYYFRTIFACVRIYLGARKNVTLLCINFIANAGPIGIQSRQITVVWTCS